MSSLLTEGALFPCVTFARSTCVSLLLPKCSGPNFESAHVVIVLPRRCHDGFTLSIVTRHRVFMSDGSQKHFGAIDEVLRSLLGVVVLLNATKCGFSFLKILFCTWAPKRPTAFKGRFGWCRCRDVHVVEVRLTRLTHARACVLLPLPPPLSRGCGPYGA